MNTKYHQTDGFKFNPAGLIGLDAGTAKGISKFLRAREREINTIETVFMICDGGPFNGQSIELQPNGGMSEARSAEFTVGAWRGHYVGAKWVSSLDADAPAPEAKAPQAAKPRINFAPLGKGFDQLRDLLAELSADPAERETSIKTRIRTHQFNYGQTDDFGNEIESPAPVGAYWCENLKVKNTTRKKMPVLVITYKIARAVHQHGASAMDDFGDLFVTTPRDNNPEACIQRNRFTTYKIGRTSYTIPATIEAAERLAARLLKIKKWFNDKLLPAPAWACRPAAPTVQAQPVAAVIDTPPALLPKIEQPAKPLAVLEVLAPMATAPAPSTCNPEAQRIRAKATICRQANRPAWANILDARADALDQTPPPEPPPGNPKPQRPRENVCILLAKIRHPVRQKIRTANPSAIISTTQPSQTPCHAHNLNPATHQPHPSKLKPHAANYPWPQRPDFAASTWHHGRRGRLAVTACQRPFGGFSKYYWPTPSCRTIEWTIKSTDAGIKNTTFSLLKIHYHIRQNLDAAPGKIRVKNGVTPLAKNRSYSPC